MILSLAELTLNRNLRNLRNPPPQSLRRDWFCGY
jgi:hypothetical protein